MPRWRMMIAPGLATWSPYILTPRRCPLESPLGVAPVLCAPGSLLVRHLDGQPPRRHRHAHRGAADGERSAVTAEEGRAHGRGRGREGEAL